MKKYFIHMFAVLIAVAIVVSFKIYQPSGNSVRDSDQFPSIYQPAFLR